MPFEKGQSGNVEKQFSSTNQPENNGRKPKSFTLFNRMMKEQGVEPLSKEALIECYSFLFSATQAQIEEVADDNDQPLGLRLIIAEFTDERTRSKAMQDYRDYMFGKALQNTDVTSKGESINIPVINIIRGNDVKEI